jgi:hypothetical protein
MGREIGIELHYDVAVIGGGAVGLGYAIRVKRDNPELRVLVLEKAKEPRFKIGEHALCDHREPARTRLHSDYTPQADSTETAGQDATPTESYGNFGPAHIRNYRSHAYLSSCASAIISVIADLPAHDDGPGNSCLSPGQAAGHARSPSGPARISQNEISAIARIG